MSRKVIEGDNIFPELPIPVGPGDSRRFKKYFCSLSFDVYINTNLYVHPERDALTLFKSVTVSNTKKTSDW